MTCVADEVPPCNLVFKDLPCSCRAESGWKTVSAESRESSAERPTGLGASDEGPAARASFQQGRVWIGPRGSAPSGLSFPASEAYQQGVGTHHRVQREARPRREGAEGRRAGFSRRGKAFGWSEKLWASHPSFRKVGQVSSPHERARTTVGPTRHPGLPWQENTVLGLGHVLGQPLPRLSRHVTYERPFDSKSKGCRPSMVIPRKSRTAQATGAAVLVPSP